MPAWNTQARSESTAVSDEQTWSVSVAAEAPVATACAAARIPSVYPARLLDARCWRRPQTAISVTAAPMTSSRIVVSTSSRLVMSNVP
jgi:hypothetical protein